MPQNEYIEEAQRRFGKRLNHAEKERKKAARKVKKDSKVGSGPFRFAELWEIGVLDIVDTELSARTRM